MLIAVLLLLLPVWLTSNQAWQSHAARAFYLLNKYKRRESRKYWPAAAAVCGVESM
jgi:hypothetical protein